MSDVEQENKAVGIRENAHQNILIILATLASLCTFGYFFKTKKK